jgi:hypothetical protein
MSRLYFTAETGEAEVLGRERHYAVSLTRDLFLGSLIISDVLSLDEGLLSIMDGVSTYHKGRDRFGPYILDDGPYYTVGDQRIDAASAAINTLIQTGCDPLVLMARIHGSCEDHLWVDEPDRGWLAGVITEGRRLNIMRAGMGWEATAAFLDDVQAVPGPVVMHFSVSASFPNQRIAGDHWEGDEWYEESEADRWRLAMEGLRAAWLGLQLREATFRTWFYGPGTTRPLTAFDINAAIP